MSDIQEAKCFEFTVQILPPPLGAPRRRQKNHFCFAQTLPPPRFISVYALVYTNNFKNKYTANIDQIPILVINTWLTALSEHRYKMTEQVILSGSSLIK